MAFQQAISDCTKKLVELFTPATDFLSIFWTIAVFFLTRLLLETLAFDCPCVVDEVRIPALKNCTKDNIWHEDSCFVPSRKFYGWTYVIGPAAILVICGCASKLKNGERWDIAVAHSTFIAILWVSICFMDGDFPACAQTAVPYAVSPDKPNCPASKHERQYSTEYWNNVFFYHLIGWILAVLLAFVASIASCCNWRWSKKYCHFMSRNKNTEDPNKNYITLEAKRPSEELNNLAKKTDDMTSNKGENPETLAFQNLWKAIESIMRVALERQQNQISLKKTNQNEPQSNDTLITTSQS